MEASLGKFGTTPVHTCAHIPAIPCTALVLNETPQKGSATSELKEGKKLLEEVIIVLQSGRV